MYADDITLVANLSTFCINNGLNIDININNELALLSDWLKLNIIIIAKWAKNKTYDVSHSTKGSSTIDTKNE